MSQFFSGWAESFSDECTHNQGYFIKALRHYGFKIKEKAWSQRQRGKFEEHNFAMSVLCQVGDVCAAHNAPEVVNGIIVQFTGRCVQC